MLDHIEIAGLTGEVTQTSSKRGLLWEGKNQVVNLAPEMVIEALMGSSYLKLIGFGYGNGRPVTPSTKSLPNVITMVDASPAVGRDKFGRRTLATWRATWVPSAPQTYDMLGLLSSTQRLFSATAFPSITLSADEAVSVAWTIYLRG
jgi:hypothetical protein